MKLSDILIPALVTFGMLAGLLLASQAWVQAGRPGQYHCPGCNCKNPDRADER